MTMEPRLDPMLEQRLLAACKVETDPAKAQLFAELHAEFQALTERTLKAEATAKRHYDAYVELSWTRSPEGMGR